MAHYVYYAMWPILNDHSIYTGLDGHEKTWVLCVSLRYEYTQVVTNIFKLIKNSENQL